MLKDFSLKFVDVMIGVVLGVGFQWWPELHDFWQHVAFLFIYLNLVDFWIDYSPTLKKFPIKREFDVIIHTFLVFLMFYMIYSVTLSIQHIFISYGIFRLLDILWIHRMRKGYPVSESDMKFLSGWNRQDIKECIGITILFILRNFMSL